MYNDDYITIKKSDLDETIKQQSGKIVGRVLKRFEIHDNIEVLKKEIRELLYEGFRDLEGIIVSGCKVTTFKFLNSKNQNQGKVTPASTQ